MLSVGSILQKERLRQGYTLAHVEKRIKVREKFLKDLENNYWSNFSSYIYIVGIIKNYAEFLNLDEKKILAFFRREYEKKDDVRFKRKVSSSYFVSDTRRAVVASLAFIFLFFFGYFGYQMFIYVTPPKLVILEPTKTVFRRTDKVKIVGQTEKEASVTIFGQRVYQDSDGIFEYSLPLKNKVNKVTIEVVGANGKKTVIQKEYIREI